MAVNIGIGIKLERSGKTTQRAAFDEFSDGTTLITLGMISGVLSLWYTETDEVITTWDNE